MSRKLIGNKAYHTHEGISSSFLKEIAEKSLYHALNIKKEATDAMILGSALHCLLLTPEEFELEFCEELKREDFSNVVETVDEIKERLTELTSQQLSIREKELDGLRSDKAKLSQQRKVEINKLKKEMEQRKDNVDPTRFQTKKAYNARLRDISENTKKYVAQERASFKAKIEATQQHITQCRRRISELKRFKSGNRQKLIKNLKSLDPKTIIWSELVHTYRQDNADKYIISKADLEKAKEMRRSILNHPKASQMLRGGECEYAYFAECPDTGLPIKCKPDLKNLGLIDLKSTRDASDQGFIRECLKRKYHVQAAYYIDVHSLATDEELKDFYFIVVENTFPFAVNVMRLGDRELGLGRIEYKNALKQYVDYLEVKQHRPLNAFGYGQEIGTITYPKSAFYNGGVA